MKMRHLPPTDLARIAPLPTDEKVQHLRRFKLGSPPYTYAPFRLAIPDILDASGLMFESLGPTPFGEIERKIKKAKTTPDGVSQNLLVARALFSAAKSAGITARQRPFFSMSIGLVDQIRFWNDLYIVMDGRAWIPFFDARRANRLSDLGRKFVYSLQHEHIRKQDSDFAKAGLMVVQFGDDGESRLAKLIGHGDSDLYSYEQLQEMISETYRLWIEISEERSEEVRRRAGGARGGLL